MAAAEEVTSRCFAPVDGEPDERRESAGVALSQTTPARDNSRRTLLDGKMVDGVEGIMRVCPELCSPLCLVCINVFFSISSSFLACYPPPTLLLLLFHLSLSVCIMWCFHCGYNSANRCWPPGSAASLHIAFSPLALSDIHIRSQTLTPLSRRSLTIPHFRKKKTARCEDGDLARFIFFTWLGAPREMLSC